MSYPSLIHTRVVTVLHRTSHLLDILCRYIVIACCLGMTGVIGAQVFFRYGLNNSLFWSEELGRILLVQLTFYGSAVAYRASAHIGVDTLVCRFSPRMRGIAQSCTYCASLFLFCIMIMYGFEFAEFISAQRTTTLGISKQIPFLAVPVSGCIMAVHSLSFLFRPAGISKLTCPERI